MSETILNAAGREGYCRAVTMVTTLTTSVYRRLPGSSEAAGAGRDEDDDADADDVDDASVYRRLPASPGMDPSPLLGQLK